jgi:UDP-N-acetylglucosamine 2-epimerase
MNKIFFDELHIPEPDYNLDVGSGSHGSQTGEMLKRIEKVLIKEKTELVVVYGDTNSTLAGALASAKLHIPVAHVEAGLRSNNKKMPEEINRILTDHISSLLFCPTKTAVKNLQREGFANIFNEGRLIDEKSVSSLSKTLPQPIVINVGDVMYDAMLMSLEIAEKKSDILKTYNLKPRSYYLATVHRAANTDNIENLRNIFLALVEIGKDKPVICPLHPRTKKIIDSNLSSLITGPSSLIVIDPVSYFDMLILEKNAEKILTDSGGMQKEAYLLKVPCITLRNETEWVETVESRWNVLVGVDREMIVGASRNDFLPLSPHFSHNVYGDSKAAKRIKGVLLQYDLEK